MGESFCGSRFEGAIAGDAHSRRGRCWRPAGRRQDTGCLVRRPWVAVLPCGRTFVGLNPADTPSAGAPGGRSVWGLPGGCLVRRFCPAAMRFGDSTLRPDVCRSEPGGHAVGQRPWGPFRLGAAWRPFVRRRQRAPIQSAWRASRRKTGMVASGAAAVTVRPPGWTAPVCSSVQSAPAGR